MVRQEARFRSESSGQSVVETALAIPFLFVIILNAINFSYFFFVALNLTAAPRSGAEYSILGSATPAATALPQAGSSLTTTLGVSYLPVQDLADMAGVTSSGGAVEIQVCTAANGVSGSGSSQTSTCTQYNGFTATTPDSDPGAPTFVLNRVDVKYTFSPLFPGAPFNLASLAFCSSTTSCTFYRHVEMRAMGE
jgi:Flp pilus assembly protein TadG